MEILMAIDTLTIGGAETFVLRLSEALVSRGHRVQIYVQRGDLINWKMVEAIAPSVVIVSYRVPMLRFVQKIDGLLFKIGSEFSLLRWIQVQKMRTFLSKNEIEVVHSNLMTTDIITSRACGYLGIPWITTLHGDYLRNEEINKNQASRIQSFDAIFREVKKNVSEIVCITDMHLLQLRKLAPELDEKSRLHKIYNGYESFKKPNPNSDKPEVLKVIPEGAFVVGMVARGIQEKGWDVLIKAFKEVQQKDLWLVLVGDGEYLQKVKISEQHTNIIFTGNVIDPLNYINHFNLCCFLSRCFGESLPTTLIEYLYLNKPLITSRIGEVANMIDESTDHVSGIIIESGSLKIMVEETKNAIQLLYSDESLQKTLSQNSAISFKKFEMEECINDYLYVYKKAMKQTK